MRVRDLQQYLSKFTDGQKGTAVSDLNIYIETQNGHLEEIRKIIPNHFLLVPGVGAQGGSLKDVIRTRVFVNNIEDWEVVARAHGVRFKNIDPANTLVQAKLVGEGYKVEIEAEAVLD